MPVRTLITLLILPFLLEGDDAGPRVERIRKELAAIAKSANWDDVKRRRDLVTELAGIDHSDVQEVLYKVFVDDREQVCRIPAMIGLGKRGGTKALKAMTSVALREHDEVFLMCLPLAFAGSSNVEIGSWLARAVLPRTVDAVQRAAVVESLGLLRCGEAFEPVKALLGKERGNLRIAYEALIALGRIGRARSISVLLPFLEHESPVLREGALVALAESGHPGAVEIVPEMVGDPDVRVREAVAELILTLRAEAGIPALIELVRSGRLRLMETARGALREFSGEDFGHDADAWERWYGLKSSGRLPPKDWKASGSSVATYYGMRVFSDRLLFIIDVSGSMAGNVTGRKSEADPQRIDIAKRELTKTLDQLDERTMFNVVGFSGSPTWWQDREAKATKKNLALAKRFVERLPVGGGTNVYDTFVQALEKNRLVDTIYFLGDGSPSLGRYIEQEEILARIRWMNRFRKIRIHTIALLRGEIPMVGMIAPRLHDEEEAARFLARLATDHGGEFVRVDE